MKLNELFLEEFNDEMDTTRKFLEAISEDLFDYIPHEKSMRLIDLVNHMLPISSWVPKITQQTALDWSTETPPVAKKTKENILNQFEKNVTVAQKALKDTNNDQLLEPWTMKSGDTILFTGTKQTAIRRYVLNHIIHHRAQLSLYLRINNGKVPASYVRSADEMLF